MNLTAIFFIIAVAKPLKVILRLVFYKIVVRAYGHYLFWLKRLGLEKPLALLVNQKSLHFVVASLVIVFIVINLTAKTQAVTPEEYAGKTFLTEIISQEFGENDQLIEEYFDEEAGISPVQQTYLDNLTTIKIQPSAEMQPADETDGGSDLSGLPQDSNALIKPDLASTNKSKQPRQEITSYTVQAGDTVSTIAAKFDISVNTILWENNLSAFSLIRPGDGLSILPVSGVGHQVRSGENLNKIAQNYGVEASAILAANKLVDDDQLQIGEKLIIPGGRKGAYAQPASIARSYTGLSVIKDLIKPESAKPSGGNKLNWPTIGYRITQYFTWRHHAVDIANKAGTPIYAADTGVIEVAGWGRGYGNQIVIDHGGGKKTRYAHMSKFYVGKGEQVAKGQTIGAMGSTGWSTGPHVHFEIIINGLKYNPLNYIK